MGTYRLCDASYTVSVPHVHLVSRTFPGQQSKRLQMRLFVLEAALRTRAARVATSVPLNVECTAEGNRRATRVHP